MRAPSDTVFARLSPSSALRPRQPAAAASSTDSVGTRAQPGVVVTLTSAPTRDDREPRASAQRAGVRAFASSYGRYLDGRLPGHGAGRRDTERRRRRPARRSQPTLGRAASPWPTFTGPLTPTASRSGIAIALTATQRSSRSLDAAARWQITQVVAPDLDSILRQQPPDPADAGIASRPPRSPRDSCDEYLPWLYGHARATAIPRHKRTAD